MSSISFYHRKKGKRISGFSAIHTFGIFVIILFLLLSAALTTLRYNNFKDQVNTILEKEVESYQTNKLSYYLDTVHSNLAERFASLFSDIKVIQEISEEILNDKENIRNFNYFYSPESFEYKFKYFDRNKMELVLGENPYSGMFIWGSKFIDKFLAKNELTLKPELKKYVGDHNFYDLIFNAHLYYSASPIGQLYFIAKEENLFTKGVPKVGREFYPNYYPWGFRVNHWSNFIPNIKQHFLKTYDKENKQSFPILTPLYKDLYTQKPLISFLVPVWDHQNSELKGYIDADIFRNELFEFNNKQLVNDGFFFFLNNQNKIQYLNQEKVNLLGIEKTEPNLKSYFYRYSFEQNLNSSSINELRNLNCDTSKTGKRYMQIQLLDGKNYFYSCKTLKLDNDYYFLTKDGPEKTEMKVLYFFKASNLFEFKNDYQKEVEYLENQRFFYFLLLSLVLIMIVFFIFLKGNKSIISKLVAGYFTDESLQDSKGALIPRQAIKKVKNLLSQRKKEKESLSTVLADLNERLKIHFQHSYQFIAQINRESLLFEESKTQPVSPKFLKVLDFHNQLFRYDLYELSKLVSYFGEKTEYESEITISNVIQNINSVIKNLHDLEYNTQIYVEGEQSFFADSRALVFELTKVMKRIVVFFDFTDMEATVLNREHFVKIGFVFSNVDINRKTFDLAGDSDYYSLSEYLASHSNIKLSLKQGDEIQVSYSFPDSYTVEVDLTVPKVKKERERFAKQIQTKKPISILGYKRLDFLEVYDQQEIPSTDSKYLLPNYFFDSFVPVTKVNKFLFMEMEKSALFENIEFIDSMKSFSNIINLFTKFITVDAKLDNYEANYQELIQNISNEFPCKLYLGKENYFTLNKSEQELVYFNEESKHLAIIRVNFSGKNLVVEDDSEFDENTKVLCELLRKIIAFTEDSFINIFINQGYLFSFRKILTYLDSILVIRRTNFNRVEIIFYDFEKQKVRRSPQSMPFEMVSKYLEFYLELNAKEKTMSNPKLIKKLKLSLSKLI